jgi:hypothetical protein
LHILDKCVPLIYFPSLHLLNFMIGHNTNFRN